MSGANRILLAALLAILLFTPLFASNYIIYVVVLAMLYSMLTASYDLMTGYTGPLSFCHAAFYGLGAYASAILTLRTGMPFWVAFPLSGLGVFVFAAIIGYPALKLRGHYFAVTTFFFGHFVYLFLLNTRELTNGPMGVEGHSTTRKHFRHRFFQHDRKLLSRIDLRCSDGCFFVLSSQLRFRPLPHLYSRKRGPG